jgi:hypothetical protein
LESYRNILSNPNQDRIEPHNAMAMVRGDEGRVICVELIGGNALALAATNWFRRVDGAWRMIHHQASPIAAAVGVAAPQPQGLNGMIRSRRLPVEASRQIKDSGLGHFGSGWRMGRFGIAGYDPAPPTITEFYPAAGKCIKMIGRV